MKLEGISCSTISKITGGNSYKKPSSKITYRQRNLNKEIELLIFKKILKNLFQMMCGILYLITLTQISLKIQLLQKKQDTTNAPLPLNIFKRFMGTISRLKIRFPMRRETFGHISKVYKKIWGR